jgi:hypothetical protein
MGDTWSLRQQQLQYEKSSKSCPTYRFLPEASESPSSGLGGYESTTKAELRIPHPKSLPVHEASPSFVYMPQYSNVVSPASAHNPSLPVALKTPASTNPGHR